MSMSRLLRAPVVAAAAFAVLLVLAGCPNPIDQGIAEQMLDKSVPTLDISSPQDGSEYGQSVTVQGTASDAGGRLRTLRYRVAGTLGVLLEGEVAASTIGSDGSYAFQFSTIDFDGPIVVTVIAEDWNDNVVEESVMLSDPGSPVSSLSAAPDNKRVSLAWEAIEGASGYTLYYTSDGTLPSLGYGTSVAVAGTAYDLTGLKNGKLYIFLLCAHVGAADYWSDYVDAIPLSELTLAPKVRGDYRSINLEWAEIEGTDAFVVYRAANDPNGVYTNLTGTLRGNSFTDTTVTDGTWYYYKIQPALADGRLSTYNGAQTFQAPTVQERVTSINTSVTNKRVRISGSYAYVAAGTDGILVVDIANPAAPAVVRTVDTTDARDLDISGSYLYLADGSAGLRAFTLADPAFPAQVGVFKTDGAHTIGTAVELSVVSGTHAFVLDSTSGTVVHAINTTTPSALAWMSSYTNASYTFEDVAACVWADNPSYEFLYITTGSGDVLLEIYFYNLSFYSYRSYTDPDYFPRKVTVSGSYVYLLGKRNVDLEPPDENALLVLSKFPAAFTKVGQGGEISGYAADVRAAGNRAYAVDSIGFHLYDVSDPADPVLLDYLNTPGSPTGVDAGSSYAFIASGVLLFQTVDLTLPTSLSLLATYDGAGSSGALGAAVRGDYAYVAATGPSRLQILDVSSPESPSEAGYLTLSAPRAVDLSGDYAFVADSTSGLRIIDVSNPSSPAARGTAGSVSGQLNGVVVKGDYAYMSGSKGLQVFDVSDPDAPFWVGLHDTDGGGVNDVEIRGSTVYATDGAYFQPNSLKLLDVSEPGNPALIARALTHVAPSTHSTMTAYGVALLGDYALVTDNFPFGGMYAVNVNPASANFLKDYGSCNSVPAPEGGLAAGIAASGSHAFVADNDGGLSVVNLADPTSLSDGSLVANLLFDPDANETQAVDVVVSGGLAYVSDSELGLKIVALIP